MENGKLTIYKASAGSGKTFRLALEYIKLLLADPQAYRYILAVTFTNDATGEMKQRILAQLDGLRKGDTSSTDFKKQLIKDTGYSETFIKRQAGVALSNILHDYTRFQIRTIDSFFQLIVKNLAHDLGLPPNQQIIIDNTPVLEEAVDQLIESLDAKSPVFNGIKDLIEQRIENDQRVDIARELKDFGKLVFNEEFLKHRLEINKALQDNNIISSYKNALYNEKKRLNQKTNYLTLFYNRLQSEGLQESDIKRVKSVTGFLAKVDALDFKHISDTIKGYIEDTGKWLKTSSPDSHRASIERTLRPFIKDVFDEYQAKIKQLNTIQLSGQHFNQMRLLDVLSKSVHDIVGASNSFLLSETPGLIHDLVRKEDSPFVFEKIGTQLRHIMIDEFQDTSRLQWENFKILLDECLANGEGSLLVGDVKQSIYRWRNSDWNILNGMNGQTPGTEVVKLDTNYRSNRNVIAFNNNLFVKILEGLCTKVTENGNKEEFAKLVTAYSDVYQQCPSHKPEQGYVNVKLFEGDAEDGKEWMKNSVLERILDLKSRGIHYSDIMLLVRRKADIEEMADFLSKHLPDTTIISDEAFRLDASPALQALIAALRLINNPDDGTSALTLAAIYRKEVLKMDFDWQHIDSKTIQSYFPAAFRQLSHSQAFRMLPLYELLEKLTELFNLGTIAGQDAYLYSFFDQVTLYLQNAPSDVANFLNFWDETLCNVPAASNAVDGIRIKTIHKAKGLEFHTVIIPYCNWNMEGMNTILCPPVSLPDYKKTPSPSIPLLLLDYGSRMKESYYKEYFEREQMQQWVDNLNLLYVALTRPKSNLFILGRKNGHNYSVETLLKDALEWETEEQTEDTDENNKEKKNKNKVFVHEEGTLVKSKTGQKAGTKAPVIPDIRIKSYSKAIEFRESNRSKDFITEQTDGKPSNRQEYIERGKLLHNVFSSIRTTDDIDKVLTSLEFEGIIGSRHVRDNVQQAIGNLLNNEIVKGWFSGKWHIRNECNILSWKNGEIEERRPDRVMLGKDETIVVDFKFGSERPEYDEQVREYMRTLRRMGYPHVRGYLWFVLEGNKVKEIIA